MAKKIREGHRVEKIPGARLVVWAAKPAGYCVRVLGQDGQVLKEFKTRFPGSGRWRCGCRLESSEEMARKAAERIAQKLRVGFVCRDQFKWKWFEPDADEKASPQAAPPEVSSTGLIYSVVDDSLVFIEPQEAEELAACHAAWRPPMTWSDLKSKIAPAHFEGLCRLFDVEKPDENALLDVEKFDPYSDGSWPAWPAQEMLDWVPEEIAREFGELGESLISGQCLTIPADREAEVVEAFKKLGYECVRDDSLVRRACGYSG